MHPMTPVSPETFNAIQNVDVDKLAILSEKDLRPILPCLVRMALCAPLDLSAKWTANRKKILQNLSGIEVVNPLVGLLSIDFHVLEQDARKEQQLRCKAGSSQSDSVLILQLDMGLGLEFEKSDAVRKLRLLLSELLFIISQMREPKAEFYEKSSELFENEVYLEEVSDVLCIAQAELPSLMRVNEVAEALLHVKNGGWLLCRLVANVPDSFLEVCTSLVSNGEKQDEDMIGGRRRSEALRMLCEMNPSQALAVRALCVEHCRMPSLAVAVTLHHSKSIADGPTEAVQLLDGSISDLVAFISGLLLGSDANVRNWFAQFVRNGQKKKQDSSISMVQELRKELMKQLSEVLPQDGCNVLSDSQVVSASAFIRLYCALKGIATMRFEDDEVKLLLKLVTCQPPATASGVRFVSLGLCMLLACPILGNIEQEKIAIDWIKWLVKEESYFERKSGVSASFGEMLLLIAIHFHSNQTSAIAELVSSMLGMKSAVKTNSLTRMKTIFTQEIFTEQVVTAHAVNVPVTPQLNANITGFLAVHCIYQLLKSRAFSKHKVPIKNWIYKQVCSATTPIHPLLPLLIEVFVNSIILPNAKTDYTNEPISEEQMLAVFDDSIMKREMKRSGDDGESMEVEARASSAFTAQLLLLYYLLLYQDTKLNNMKTIVTSQRKLHTYSQSLVACLPIRYLLQQAQRAQQQYAGLFSPLLRLLATHFPHLCLVQDWLDEEMTELTRILPITTITANDISVQALQQSFYSIQTSPSELIIVFEHLLTKPPCDLIPYADVFTSNLRGLLQPGMSRKLLVLTQRVWSKLNTVIPRKLWVLTVNCLCSHSSDMSQSISKLTQDDITVDPLAVLRCDSRIYRCAPFLEIILQILDAFLHASRIYLTNHIAATPTVDKTGQLTNVIEREELRNALVAAQESAVVQILLESCLPKLDEKEDRSLLNDRREIQCIIFSHLHQMFISDPNLVKLVHFQGYPSELLPLTVTGIPSMHICLDFIPELLSQPDMEKQMFAIELVSHLSLQYALPKSMGIAKLSVNVMSTLLTVLSCENRAEFFLRTLPSLVKIYQAFPPLCDDIVTLLVQLGQITNSHIASISNTAGWESLPYLPDKDVSLEKDCFKKNSNKEIQFDILSQYKELNNLIQSTFADITKKGTVMQGLY